MRKQLSNEPLTKVFVGLGGNLNNPLATLQAAVKDLEAHQHIERLTVSRYYSTSPVSSIHQENYVNAVCQLWTSINMRDFSALLKQIEQRYGKLPKVKDAPRPIDLDLLLFGCQISDEIDLKVPHPEWKNRLFVLRPMLDIAAEVIIPSMDPTRGVELFDVGNYLKSFSNPNRETVHVIEPVSKMRILCEKSL